MLITKKWLLRQKFGLAIKRIILTKQILYLQTGSHLLMTEPLVSVITPAYNAGNFIHETIDSVIAQTYTNWELIIIDDGSTDNTAAIVKQYVVRDSRIKYLYQQNGKQGKARNNGMTHSSGTIIAFLDADDTWTPHKL